MFLYARVVMDNVVQMCYTSEMVKNELKVLPENLDEAYVPHSEQQIWISFLVSIKDTLGSSTA